MKCKKCQSIMTFSGFERVLITRGKDKGMTKVRDFYKCSQCEKKKQSQDIYSNHIDHR